MAIDHNTESGSPVAEPPKITARKAAHGLPKLADIGPDLTQIGRGGQAFVIGRPIVLMLIYVGLAGYADAIGFNLNRWYWWLASLFVFLFGYIALIVAVHDLCHRALKLSRAANQVWLSVLGVMGEVSGSAIQATHIVHHRNFSLALAGNMPEGSHVYDDDPETAFGGLNLWRAMAVSPFYQLSLWRWTRQQREGLRRTTAVEAISHFALGITSIVVLPWTRVPFIYAVAVFLCSIVFPVISIRLFQKCCNQPVRCAVQCHGSPWDCLTTLNITCIRRCLRIMHANLRNELKSR
jgi:fatty acid desaturase